MTMLARSLVFVTLLGALSCTSSPDDSGARDASAASGGAGAAGKRAADGGMAGSHSAAGASGQAGQAGQAGKGGAGAAAAGSGDATGQDAGADDTDAAVGPSAPTGKRCGARAGDTCKADEYCAYHAGLLCGAADAEATCQKRPKSCTGPSSAVCGCDQQTYQSACAANLAGIGIYADKTCQ